jgi:N-methylhydantoinase B
VQANTRTPAANLGDLKAQVASLRLANDRVAELTARCGITAVLAAQRRILEHGEAFARRVVLGLPDSVYRATAEIEGFELSPAPSVAVTVTTHGDTMVCDFAGSSQEVALPINLPERGLVSSARVVLQALLGLEAPQSGRRTGRYKDRNARLPLARTRDDRPRHPPRWTG